MPRHRSALRRPRREVGVGLLRAQALNRAADPNLAVELAPIDRDRAASRALELARLRRLVVRVEAKATLIEALEEDHPRVRVPSSPTVARQMASGNGTSASASSHHPPNCSIGSSARSSRRSGGMSGRRGTLPTAFYNGRLGAISSVGQSASLIRRRSLVRVQDRPPRRPPPALRPASAWRRGVLIRRGCSASHAASCGSSGVPSPRRTGGFEGPSGPCPCDR